jgi:molybdenum cofactor guanylyltransferase
VTLNEQPHHHHKHVKLPRPDGGEWGRNEWAILGAPCGTIRQLAQLIIAAISNHWEIAYLDADHLTDESAKDPLLAAGAGAVFTNKITYQQLNHTGEALGLFQKRATFNEQDLILVNGNHFTGKKQLVIIDPAKPVEKKLEKLKDVSLILLKDENTTIPEAVAAHLPNLPAIPTLLLSDTTGIVAFIEKELQQSIPPLNGLVLTGGKSVRMGIDKSELAYFGKPQRQHVYDMLSPLCRQVFVSVNEEGQAALNTPTLKDRFIGIGPMGGILTALQSNPDAAWLVLACDLPYLTRNTLQFLIEHRNPSKLATAFYEPNGTFPEPLITIWEPRSYAVLLQALSQGYSCPRKVLINSNVEMLQVPHVQELTNVNDPAAYEMAKRDLQAMQIN